MLSLLRQPSVEVDAVDFIAVIREKLFVVAAVAQQTGSFQTLKSVQLHFIDGSRQFVY